MQRWLSWSWLVLWLFGFMSVSFAAAPQPELATKARSAILVDAATGQTLYEKAADSPSAIASMTKLMTLYLAMRALEKGKVHWNDPVPVSEEAYRTGGSQIWLEPGETLPFGQLLKAIAIGSANDACVAVAEFLAGSVPNFVAEMNSEAKRLGMHHTHFANPHGLDQADHYSTARDMAILARAAVRVPGLLALTRQREDRTIRDGKGGHLWLVNHNRLLGRYPGLDGLKTGYTDKAGYCLTATAEREGMRLIAVVMGLASSKERFAEAANLLNYGFANWQSVHVISAGARFGPIPVVKGTARNVYARVPGGVAVLLPRTAERTPKLTTAVSLPRHLVAPVTQGQVLGEVRVLADGKVVAKAPLRAEASVARLSWMDLFWRLLGGVLHFG